jgi:hypothetical protein
MSFSTRHLVSWVLMPLLVALPLALFISHGALQHNPQQEFCAHVAHGVSANYSVQGEDCNIRWGGVGLLFGVWLFAQVVILAVARMVLSAFRGK